MKSPKALIKNGKFFVQPDAAERDFKTLFKHLADAGAGRPVDRNGFPQGPWTPDLLAEAISLIDANRGGVELRTVQLWFQDNDKGISPDNIRWLARIFGCDDPEATSAWQAELSASHRRLISQRRERQKSPVGGIPETDSLEEPVDEIDDRIVPVVEDDLQTKTQSIRRYSLARTSEAIFGGGSFLDLPVSVFAGAVGLGFMSVFLGVHSITYAEQSGVSKQVGFLWAPNWTLLFMVFMPLFLGFSREVIAFWKSRGRAELIAASGSAEDNDGWSRKVAASPLTYWSVFLICVGFAGIFQWVSVRLIPLLQSGRDYAIDWGSIGIINPDLASIITQAFFTGIAYLYMCLSFYLFFVGLILIYTLAYDYRDIVRKSEKIREGCLPVAALNIERRILKGIFRCAISGLFIAICMKLQASYLVTSSSDILSWLTGDFINAASGRNNVSALDGLSAPNQYTSLVIVLVTIFTFSYSAVQIGLAQISRSVQLKMASSIFLLAISYTTIGAFNGFSMLLGISVLVAVWGLFDPWLGSRTDNMGGRINVS